MLKVKEERTRRFFSCSYSRHWPYDNTTDSGYLYDYAGFWNQRLSYGQYQWRTKVRLGLNATSFMSGTLWGNNCQPYNQASSYYASDGTLLRSDIYEGYAAFSGTQIAGYFDQFKIPVTQLISSVESRCGMEMRLAIREAQSTFQSAVFAAELGKTSRMVLGAAKQLLSGFKGLRKRFVSIVKDRKAQGHFDKDILKDVTNMYLQKVYGWDPLIGDIEKGMKTLANLAYQPLGLPIQGGAEDKTSFALENLGVAWSSNVPYEYVGGVEVTVSCRSKAFLRFGDVSSNANISRSLGGDLNSFVPSLYELIPYSFLLDYFSNIGDVISALCVNTFDLGWSWATTQTIWDFTGGLQQRPDSPQTDEFKFFSSGGNFSYRKVDFVRLPGIPAFNPLSAVKFEIPNVIQGINTMMLMLSKL